MPLREGDGDFGLGSWSGACVGPASDSSLLLLEALRRPGFEIRRHRIGALLAFAIAVALLQVTRLREASLILRLQRCGVPVRTLDRHDRRDWQHDTNGNNDRCELHFRPPQPAQKSYAETGALTTSSAVSRTARFRRAHDEARTTCLPVPALGLAVSFRPRWKCITGFAQQQFNGPDLRLGWATRKRKRVDLFSSYATEPRGTN